MPGRAPVGSIKRETIPVPYGNEMASEMFLDLDVELLEYHRSRSQKLGRPCDVLTSIRRAQKSLNRSGVSDTSDGDFLGASSPLQGDWRQL
jgi:hypothetical protein